MACYHPLPAIKKKYSNQLTVGKAGDVFTPYTDVSTGELIEPIQLPCGKCIGCRLDYSRVWADRCVLESLSYDPDRCWFVTLTYDDNSIVNEKRSLVNSKGYLSLYPKDVQDFLKRLRITWQRRYGCEKIRFFMCGEYGSTSARPHYHLLIYNLPIPDLKYYKANVDGDILYNSDEIESLWGLGYVVIGKFEWKTAAYTARYVLKKFKGKTKEETEEYYNSLDLVPEYTRCSRNPGIGRDYLDSHVDDVYMRDEIILPGGRVAKPPKYYDKIVKDYDPDLISRVKSVRNHVAELTRSRTMSATTLDEDSYFTIQENKKKNQSKVLTRLL